MKKSSKLVSILLAAAAVNNAYALDEIKVGPNAGVTLYGRASAGIDYENNVYSAGLKGSRWQTASNQWGVSYWGVKARFEVEPGITALLNLESGFGTDDGSVTDTNKLFNRAANVGIRHDRFGSVTIGTHLWIAQDIIDVDPMHFQSIGINTLVNGANDGAADRSVELRSPNLGGFHVGYQHVFGAAAGNSKRSSGDGVSLAYAVPGLTLRAVYTQHADQFGRYSGGATYGLGSRDQWVYVKNLSAGGAYAIGNTVLFAGYEQTKAPDSGYGLRETFDEQARMAWVGVNHKLNPKTTLLGAVYQLKQNFSGKKSTVGAIGVNYDWNQYLGLYATAGYIGNNNISQSMINNTGENSHALSYLDTACGSATSCDGTNQAGVYAGFVVRF